MNDAAMRAVLVELSDGFRTRNVQRLLDSFSSSPNATYAGSEAGEQATGAVALRQLFTRLLNRQPTYTFQFPDPIYSQIDGIVWLLANGHGFEHHPGQAPQAFSYRVTGALRRENNQWRWLLLAGSEPTPADVDSPAVNCGEVPR